MNAFFVIYFAGIIMNAILLLSHYLLGFLLINNTAIKNLSRSGVVVSRLGRQHFIFEPEKKFSLKTFIIDCLLSWFSALLNLWGLLTRIVLSVKNLFDPPQIKLMRYKLKNIEMSPDENIASTMYERFLLTGSEVERIEIERYLDEVQKCSKLNYDIEKIYSIYESLKNTKQ